MIRIIIFCHFLLGTFTAHANLICDLPDQSTCTEILDVTNDQLVHEVEQICQQNKGHLDEGVCSNENAIGYLAATIANNLKEMEEHPWMQSQQVSISTHAEEKESVQIWLFYKMFNDFFNLEPYNKQFNVRQKKGSTISLSKTLLISRLIYFTKLSTNKNFSEDEFTLKGYIKQYKDKRIDTANSIYF